MMEYGWCMDGICMECEQSAEIVEYGLTLWSLVGIWMESGGVQKQYGGIWMKYDGIWMRCGWNVNGT